MPIKRLRLAKGWSQARLAGISGVSVVRVAALEANKQSVYLAMKIRTLCKLAMALDCAPSDILPFLEARPKATAFDDAVRGQLVTDTNPHPSQRSKDVDER
jgi:transcriptional regulator with XRE-family HTH domain